MKKTECNLSLDELLKFEGVMAAEKTMKIKVPGCV